MAAEAISEPVPNPAHEPSASEWSENSRDSDSGPTVNVEDTCPSGWQSAAKGKQARLSIVVAGFNRERTLLEALQEILASDFPCDIELILINDSGTERAAYLLAQAADPRMIVYEHAQKDGLGKALQSVAAMATGTHTLFLDADFEYPAEDVSRMLDAVAKGRCTVVYGVHVFGNSTLYKSYRYVRRNNALMPAANIIFNAHLTDLHSSLKLIPTDLMRSIDLKENGSKLQAEISACLLRLGVRPFEVPVNCFARQGAGDRKITWRDVIACLRVLLRVRLARDHNGVETAQLTALSPLDPDQFQTGGQVGGANTNKADENNVPAAG